MIIRKGDTVRVITGDDAGATARVLRVLRSDNKVVVEGVNKVYKHLKPSRNNPQGGRLSKEMPVDVSNVMLIDPSTNQPTRVGIRVLPDGTKERFAKKSGASLGRIGRPKTKA
jgi:large subunit ribosomal protein L24